MSGFKITSIDFAMNKVLSMCYESILTEILGSIKLRNYCFNKYYKKKKDDHILYLSKVNIILKEEDNLHKIEEAFARKGAVIDGTIFARNLISEPANYLYPKSFSDILSLELGEKLGVSIKVVDKKEMHELGMQALLGVSQGSSKSPKLVVMEWNGTENLKNKPSIAFIGKGVTFDTGGVNLKPSLYMQNMKYDMGGAAVVSGLILSLAKRKSKVHVIGVVGLVENMISSTAQRPGDVVESMAGDTIEVDNTDAEGRLVIADLITYTQKFYMPKTIIDLATLTGAIVVSLGDLYAGLFSNNNNLAQQLISSSKKTNELVWKMPLHEHYDSQINSEIADVKNTGGGSGSAGSIVAAQFIQRFIDKKIDWAHLDIAGVIWKHTESDLYPKGATGFGVKLLNQYIEDFYE